MPCDYSKYPENWTTEIRPRILARAGDCCEWPGCGVRNGAEGVRDIDKVFHELGEPLFDLYEFPASARPFRIVLTIAHEDHDESNCAHTNLRAWCQLHHLRHDAQQHAENAKATREARTGQISLFE
jgi:hypothetical protein